jgi:hypothetical protein
MDGLIARGGMGEVHRAYDTRHDRVVALKLLTDHTADEPEFRQFKRRSTRCSTGRSRTRTKPAATGQPWEAIRSSAAWTALRHRNEPSAAAENLGDNRSALTCPE